MTSSLIFVTLLIPSISQYVESSSNTNCNANFADYGTSFDVCNLKKEAGGSWRPFYQINHIDGKYAYYFNIGDSLPTSFDSPPAACLPTTEHRYCPDLSNNYGCIEQNASIEIANGNAWAYQIEILKNGTEQRCFYLSNSNGGPPKWSLINDNDPVRGVKLTYLNGEFSSYCGCNREFSINFVCQNTAAYFDPELNGFIAEHSPCSYTYSVQSVHGCPHECAPNGFTLCSAHGLCSYDHTNNKSRCYCYDNYEGSDCYIINTNFDVHTSTRKPPDASQFVHTFDLSPWFNVTYDLSPWKINNPDFYQILDETKGSNRNYTYYIGIMQSIETPPLCVASLPNVSSAFAFQFDMVYNRCFVLGTVANWGLVDNIDNPARGVTINYINGSICDSTGKHREFSVSITCPDELRIFDKIQELTIKTFVDERETCKYNIEIESAFGCPYQCLPDIQDNDEFDVCSNNGLCVADPFAGFVRCLCDYGWTGTRCNIIDSSQHPTKYPTLLPTDEATKNSTIRLTTSPTGICSDNYQRDECGKCLLPTDSSWNWCVGCDGVVYSNKLFNECGVCALSTDLNFNDYGKDCRGICIHSTEDTYYVDECGQCLLTTDSRWNDCFLSKSTNKDKKNDISLLDLILLILIAVFGLLLCLCGGYVFYVKYTNKKNINAHSDYVQNLQNLQKESEGEDHEMETIEGDVININESDQSTALAQTNKL